MLQEQLKQLMQVDHSLRGDPKKDKLIDELNFKTCMNSNRKTPSKFLVGVIVK